MIANRGERRCSASRCCEPASGRWWTLCELSRACAAVTRPTLDASDEGSMIPLMDGSDAPSLPPRLVLYDGMCGLCDKSVQWLLDHDPDGKLRFAPLQGPTAASILERHPSLPRTL